VNDAKYHQVSITNKETKEKKIIYDNPSQPLCEPCAEELLKCQECKTEKAECITKDGSNDILLCIKCYYCSKCKTNQSIGKKILDNNGQVLYEGPSICKVCIGELIKCEVCKVNSAVKPDGKIRRNQQLKVCEECYKRKVQEPKEDYWKTCENCKERKSTRSGIFGWNKKQQWLCGICYEKLSREFQRTKNKKEEDQKQILRNKYLCDGCGVSCWKDQGDRKAGYYRTRIRHWDLNHCEEVKYFCQDGDYGTLNRKGNSKCAEKFKKTRQETCAQCQKREWPDMEKGWSLDYGLKTIFCSSMCHMLHHKALWEKETGKEVNKETKIPNSVMEKWVAKTELFPMELELSSEEEKDFDWEKESAKKEVLTLKEFNIALEQKSNDPQFTFKE
jgi:hypothetical protein